MMEVGLSLIPVALSRVLAGEPVPPGSRLPLTGALACYNVYPTADGRHLSVGALEPKFWLAFCQGIGREDFVDRQAEGESGQQEMIRAIEAVIRTRTLDEWQGRFRDVDACVEPIFTLEETLSSPQARYREPGSRAEPSSGSLHAPDLPFKLSGSRRAEQNPAPRLGQHTREILASLGYPDSEIEQWIRAGIAAAPA
jgi:crotonobetainyl-CoA:carnitine CoA-transferase CaiB-like acyl-CoA transferase